MSVLSVVLASSSAIAWAVFIVMFAVVFFGSSR